MKNLTKFLAVFLLISCHGNEEGLDQNINQKINVPLNVNMVDVSDEPVTGRVLNEELTYYIAEIRESQDNVLYASGVFNDLPQDLSISISTGVDYTAEVKALRKGTGYGKTIVNNTFDGIPITNAFEYANPVNVEPRNFVTSVYTSSDSTQSILQEYPELDTYYNRGNFTLNNESDDVSLTLERQVFGVEVILQSFAQGTLSVEIGENTNQIINIIAPEDSVFHLISFDSPVETASLQTTLKYDGVPFYTDNLNFERLKIKRFEIDFEKGGNSLSPFNISISETPLDRGDTTRVLYSPSATVRDVEDNTYKTVVIGNQVWMAENLRVTKYNDGVTIPNITDQTNWEELSSGAYSWYNNDASHAAVYGALYNWYTVKTDKLCPVGWHVPSDGEWNTLESFVGASTAGIKLKSGTEHWNQPDNGTNETGFTALPGGVRRHSDGFIHFNDHAQFWSSWDSDHPSTRHVWYLVANHPFFPGPVNTDIGSGLSVRCLQN